MPKRVGVKMEINSKIAIRILAGIVGIILVSLLVFLGRTHMTHKATVDESGWKTNYKYVFVHGLNGWGSYDSTSYFIKYWGLIDGDLLKSLNKAGFECYSASVDPQGSAWDRACELYAQLTGTVTDYGIAHSAEHNHERFGTDYSKNPLISEWDSKNKINLAGHSFGGATIRMLSDLMADGSEEEQNVTDESEISPLFTGGKGDWIYSITTLSAPHNGTDIYEATRASMIENGEEVTTTYSPDTAEYDLHIDRALEMNETMQTQEEVYYFSFACDATEQDDDGNYVGKDGVIGSMFSSQAVLMGKFTGTTKGGCVIDETWLASDGLVNVISAKAPLGAPAAEFDAENITSGIWNVMPTITANHMGIVGGASPIEDLCQLYADHLSMINSLTP